MRLVTNQCCALPLGQRRAGPLRPSLPARALLPGLGSCTFPPLSLRQTLREMQNQADSDSSSRRKRNFQQLSAAQQQDLRERHNKADRDWRARKRAKLREEKEKQAGQEEEQFLQQVQSFGRPACAAGDLRTLAGQDDESARCLADAGR